MKLPDAIKHLLEDHFGINYEVIGKASIESLVKNRRTKHKLISNEAYFDYLLKNKAEFDEFLEGFLIPETWFFRDTNPFLHLHNFFSNFDKSKTFLRILSIPCATGEETYSIAMTLLDSGWSSENLSVYGVDIGQKFLDIAQKGIYSKKSFSPQDACEKSKFFDQIDDNYFSVKENIRKAVHFIHGNIIDSTLFSNTPPFHAIFARNILIYFSIDARKRALANLDRLLLPDGLLFLGHADDISLLSDKFRPTAHPSAFVFEKNLPIKKEFNPIKNLTTQKKRPLTNPIPPALPKPTLTNSELLEKAEELANKGFFHEAQAYNQRYLNGHGPSSKAYFLMGQIFSAQDKLDSAEDAFKKAIYLDSNNIDALFQFELLCIKKGDLKQAKILHDRLIRLKNST